MSYTESYTVQVPFSGLVEYNYPKSEHGGRGSVSFSGKVPVCLNIDVDTKSLDDSLKGTNSALLNVAKGVTTFQEAQIMAINDREKRVTDTTINGFFRVIGSDISREISENQNTLSADIALLTQKGKAIEDIHLQMEADYRRIWTRYRDVFRRLDFECEDSIIELDRGAFELAKRNKTLLFHPFQDGAGKIMNSILENGIPELLITGARVNKKMSGILDKITDTAMIAEQYQNDSKNICNSISLQERQFEYIPVIYVQMDELSDSSKKTQCFMPDVPNQNDIDSSVNSMIKKVSEKTWKELDNYEKTEIDSYFMIQFEKFMESQGGADKRICEEILKLYRTGSMKTIDNKTVNDNIGNDRKGDIRI